MHHKLNDTKDKTRNIRKTIINEHQKIKYKHKIGTNTKQNEYRQRKTLNIKARGIGIINSTSIFANLEYLSLPPPLHKHYNNEARVCKTYQNKNNWRNK